MEGAAKRYPEDEWFEHREEEEELVGDGKVRDLHALLEKGLQVWESDLVVSVYRDLIKLFIVQRVW